MKGTKGTFHVSTSAGKAGLETSSGFHKVDLSGSAELLWQLTKCFRPRNQ